MSSMRGVSSTGRIVFLCHSSSDKSAVRELYAKLRADGIEAWLDEEDLLPGQDWDAEIRKAIRRCCVVVVCLSNASVSKSGYLQKEISFVLDVADEKPEGTIFLIPARLESCEIPDRLRRWHWVDLFDSRGYGRLFRSLASRLGSLNTEPDSPTEPSSQAPRQGTDWSKAPSKAKGIVRKIVLDRGFGFIEARDGREYFFHRLETDNFDSLLGGEWVTFEIQPSPKGPRAGHVRRL